MENRGPRLPQEQDDETKETPRWRRGVDAITDWWYENFGGPETEEDEEDQPEPARKRKKAGRFFGSKIISKLFAEHKADEPKEIPERRSPLPMSIDLLPTEPVLALEPAMEGYPALQAEEIPEELDETLDAASITALEHEEPVDRHSAEGDTRPPEPSMPEYSENFTQMPNNEQGSEIPEPITQAHAETVNITNVEINPNNVGPALVGGIIVDQLSRHRDRKIRKEAEQLGKELDATKKQQQTTAIEVSEQARRHGREELKHEIDEIKREQSKEHTHTFATTERVPVEVPPLQPKTEEKVATAVEYSSPSPDTLSNIVETKQEKLATQHIENHKENWGEREVPSVAEESNKVLAQVEAATNEHSTFVERRYERRHEVKDRLYTEEASARGAGDAHNVSPTEEALRKHPFLQEEESGDKPNMTPEQAAQTAEMYKKAVVGGLVTGAVILASLVAYLILG